MMAAIAKALVARRAGSRGSPRRVGRWVVAAGLLVAGVMAPADSLPGPLDALAPAPPVEAAAGTVVAGTPVDCSTIDPDPDDSSTTWMPEDGTDADDRECVLTADAVCPDGHVKPASGDPPPYLCYPQSCTAPFNVDQLGDYRVPLPSVDTSGFNQCQVFQLTVCSAGIGPTHEGRCRYVQRRSWECPDGEGYAQHNRFNTCYQPHTEVTGTPPPCDTATGAPDLPLLSCEDYAGDDYDNSKDCDADISSHLSDRAGGDASAYWCEFDASDLSVGCHRSPVPSGTDCAQSTGVCLKRASTTRGQDLRALGGCRAIARNIECAIHQADYADRVGTAADLEALARDIRAAGCEPCRVMPFEPLDPAECPDSALSGLPTTVDLENLQQRLGFGIGRPQKQAFQSKSSSEYCQELPPGRLTWSTLSFTGTAMVNSRVRMDLEWDEANITRTPGKGTSPGLNLCFLNDSPATLLDSERKPRPYFVVEAVPLWPAGDPGDSDDTGDRDLLEELFGEDSLGWWDALSAEQQAERTAAFYATTDTDPVQVDCNIQVPVWCVWEPQQAGYYSLTATGALAFSVNSGIRRNYSYTGSISANWLSELSNNDLNACSRDRTLAQCQLTRNSSGGVGSYIDGEPIGIQVHEVRVVSRTPSS